MAIGRVAGPLLFSNLDRQGVDLQFSTDNAPLLYLDFANFRAAINANTLNTTDTFTVNGSSKLANIKIDNTTVSSDTILTFSAPTVDLGNISQLTIAGGGLDYVMTTNGAGELSWQDLGVITSNISLTGDQVLLSSPTDGSLTVNSAYRYWTGNTSVTNAVDNLNQVMLNVYKNTYVGAVDFTANISNGPSPLTVTFTPTVLGNPDTYYWDFGDGAFSTLQTPTHTYSNVAGGVYSIYFKASNSMGTLAGAGTNGDPTMAQGSYADLTKEDLVTVYTPTPTASFTLGSSNIDSGDTVTLTNTSTNATGYIIYWGDGTYDIVIDNTSVGGPSGSPATHDYPVITGDARYEVTIEATSLTSGVNPVSVTSAAQFVRVYAEHTPTFTSDKTSGNNQHDTLPNGLVVTFTNTTSSLPGATSMFSPNRYQWSFGSTVVDVSVGSGSAGDTGVDIEHAFLLDVPTVSQIFPVTLSVFNGHSTMPYTSSTMSITVIPAPTAAFTGSVVTLSDRTGDTSRTGYAFTDLSGNDRGLFAFTNQSFNTNEYRWQYGDGGITSLIPEGNDGSPTGNDITYSYVADGLYAVTLTATGVTSMSSTDDTLVKSNYITINPVPLPPAGLGTKTLSIGSVGNTPMLAHNFLNNTINTVLVSGISVQRQTTVPATISTGVLSNVYNAATGILSAVINDQVDTPIMLTGANDVGTYGNLVITEDKDAHAVNSAMYPTNFYKVFSGKIEIDNTMLGVGVNSVQMTHSVTGDTNTAVFVTDDVIDVPTLNLNGLATVSVTTAGTLRYISSVPYFDTGAELSIDDLEVFDYIGHTYAGIANPLRVVSGSITAGTGPLLQSQNKTYVDIGLTAIPNKNTGATSLIPHTFTGVPFAITSNVAAAGRVAVLLENVNGSSAQTSIDKQINVYSKSISGFDETSIPVSPTLGSVHADNGRRVNVVNTGGSPAILVGDNYYLDHQYVGAIVNVDDAVTRYGVVQYDITDYSEYLPVGPNFSARGSNGLQYFRFAFRRATMSNFTINITGKISGLKIAAPGTAIMNTSSDNGWLDATQIYAGAGIPGDLTGAGGNGSLGCAKTAGDVVLMGQLVTGSYKLTLGSENASNATGNQILVSIALDAGDTITAISVS